MKHFSEGQTQSDNYLEIETSVSTSVTVSVKDRHWDSCAELQFPHMIKQIYL